MDGDPCFREYKPAHVERWLASRGLGLAAFDRSRFYSDSINDLPLLEAVSDPVAAWPDERLRALALLAVPTGHWLVGGFILDGGGLHNASPLATFGALAPASWVLQMLGIFFLVGGHASVLSLRRATERGSPPALGCAAGSPGWAARCSG